MKTPNRAILCTLLLAAGVAQAQSKVQCSFNTASNRYEASLQWRNTLGTERANAYCAQAAPQKAVELKTGEAKAQPAEKLEFTTKEGERASQAMQRWAASIGFSLIWSAPNDLDNQLTDGTFTSFSALDAVSNFIEALNQKNANKGHKPLEALVYQNQVMQVVVKDSAAAPVPAPVSAMAVSTSTKVPPTQPAAASEPAAEVKRWQIFASDVRLDNTLNRWASVAGMKMLWDAKQHVMLSAEDTFVGSFEQALERVLSSPAIRQSDYPLQACVYPNSPPLLRITRLGDQSDCQK
jgi:hypothetical protein